MHAAPPPAPKPRPTLWSRFVDWIGGRPRFPSDSPSTQGPPTGSSRLDSLSPSRELPRLSDYTLQQVVARNERRTVYRAVDDKSGRVVALKTVLLAPGTTAADRAAWRERFLREAEAASRLRHPDIVRVRAGGVQGEGDATTGWLALEWVPGADLSRYTTPNRLLPERLVLGIAARVAQALHHAHTSGILHRDIKPGNVMFDPASGSVKVTDFGSARVADSEATSSGMIVGTPAYMAPEQLAGAEATPQSDLYSVGVMLHELLTGYRPFDAPSMGDLLARIARTPAPRVTERRPELPPLIDDIVARLLAKSPDARHRDGRQLATELQVAQSTLAAAPPAPPPSSPAVISRPLDPDDDDELDPFAPTMPFEDDEDLPLSDAQSERPTPPQVPSSSPSS
jgi:serine/threonine-protein kinase